MFEALFALFFKHFICDFPLQISPWMYRNKGTYMHLGGIAHSGIHGIGTLIVLFPFIGTHSLMFAAFDFIVHYHIDWAKVNIGRHYNLKPDNSDWFWILLGLDQFLHHATYFIIIYLAFK